MGSMVPATVWVVLNELDFGNLDKALASPHTLARDIVVSDTRQSELSVARPVFKRDTMTSESSEVIRGQVG